MCNFMNALKKTILIVEDDDAYREMIATLLVKKGYDVKKASNGKVALQELSFCPVDLVVSDIKMPVMHGLDLLVQVKKKLPKDSCRSYDRLLLYLRNSGGTKFRS